MDGRTSLSFIAGSLFAAPLAAEAQQARKVYRIDFLGSTSPSGYGSQLEAFRRGLRDLGSVGRLSCAVALSSFKAEQAYWWSLPQEHNGAMAS